MEHNDTTDLSETTTGCAVLFLNYLHHQLGFSWRDIVTHRRPTLGATHATLTGSRSTGWLAFTTLVSRHCPSGTHNVISGDNIFPLT